MIEKFTAGEALTIDRLIGGKFGFATWRMPNDHESKLIISLNPIRQPNIPLSEIDRGFLFNRYKDNHPINPWYLKADVEICTKEITIDPTISTEKLDEFFLNINQKIIQRNKTISTPECVESNGNFEKSISAATEAIKEGEFDKVVLARYADQKIPSNFSAQNFYEKICSLYPNSFCSLVYTPEFGLWIGASPELLASSSDSQFQTISLAGTKSLESNQPLSQIAWTQKEIEEQAFVSRYIIDCFKKIRLREFSEQGPQTVKIGDIVHLKTNFTVDKSKIKFENLANQMLNLLHPTSAVCGMPINEAKNFIRQHENFDREFYSGFLGPVNMAGKTDLFVNLRCMKVEEDKIRFFAGAGITKASIPSAELKETTLKMNVLRNLLK